MDLIFPIVGVRHYLPEEELPDFTASLPEGAEIVLVYDNANPYDRYAIQVWMELEWDDVCRKMQVGYVSSDYAPLIRDNYPDDSMLYAHVVHPCINVVEETSFMATIPIDHSELPILPVRIDGSPIANIPLPMVQPEQKMAIDEIFRFHALYFDLDENQVQDSVTVQSLIELAHRCAPCLNKGLSADERNAYILLSTMLADMHSYWPEHVEDVWLERWEMDENHRDAFKTPELCAQVMETELQVLRQNSTLFFDQYTAVLSAGLTTREQEIKAHQQWLMALPDNLYAWVKNKPKFASKLYYERFSMDELYAIYMHLLCVEWLKNTHEEKLPDFALQALSKFSFWHPRCSWTDKRTAIQEWREAVVLSKKPIATLVLRITQAQKRYVLKKNIEPLTKFVQELNLFLDQPIKENSLRKRLGPKSSKSGGLPVCRMVINKDDDV